MTEKQKNPLAESFNALSLIRFAFPSMVMMLFMGLYTCTVCRQRNLFPIKQLVCQLIKEQLCNAEMPILRMDSQKVYAACVGRKTHHSNSHIGLTIHDYAKRRQLTEAAKLLVFSAKPIIGIALMSGYESQQAFTDIFKL